MSFLSFFTILLLLITMISLFNEKALRMPNDIALLLFSFLLCAAFRLVSSVFPLEVFQKALAQLSSFRFDSYLLDGVLCFMLFAGAGKVNFGKFTSNLGTITLLSFMTTAVSAFLYGGIFYLAARLIGWDLGFWVCVLLGCIASPTDPIAATGIMNKLGLSKNVTTVIESESLFNDGMGVVLFAFVKSIAANLGQENFILLMLREVLGAAVVALAVSAALFWLAGKTRRPMNHILLSLLTVSLAYTICEICGFSGVIASVLCGMVFSYGMEKLTRFRQVIDREDTYTHFWDSIDSLLNSVLFVLIGITALTIPIRTDILLIAVAAVLTVILSRAAGVALPTVLIRSRTVPGGYNVPEFVTLMTWSALKGGLTLALVLSTREFLPAVQYELLLDAAYVTIFFTVIVQGLTTKRVYRMIERHKSLRIRKESEKRCAL